MATLSEQELARIARNASTLVEHAHVGMLVHRAGPIAFANPALASALGIRDASELVGRPFTSIFHGDDLGGRFAVPAEGAQTPIVARLAGVDGRVTWAEVHGVAITYDDAPAMLLVLRDLTGERRARATLHEREGRSWSLFMDSPISLWELDLSAAFESLRGRVPGELTDADVRAVAPGVRFIAINEATLALFEADQPDQIFGALPELFGDSGRALFRDLFAAMVAKRTQCRGDLVARTRTGRTLHLGVRANVLPGHEDTWARVVVSMFDLTAHKEQEAIVQAALGEKEVMLREINHRIKNNLQIISSLLSLQSQHVADPQTRQAFAESQRRVYAIALVHDHLYQAKNLARVNLGSYLQQLGDSVVRAHEAARQSITMRYTSVSVEVGVDLAIPCGLLVNELVANAVQHAFPDRSGTIEVTLERTGGRVTIGVSDDGIGLPLHVHPEQATTLGLGLAMTFAEQLEATISVSRDRGTAFQFAFDVPGYAPSQ